MPDAVTMTNDSLRFYILRCSERSKINEHIAGTNNMSRDWVFLAAYLLYFAFSLFISIIVAAATKPFSNFVFEQYKYNIHSINNTKFVSRIYQLNKLSLHVHVF